MGHYGPAVEATDHASGEEERDLLCECVVCVSVCSIVCVLFVKGAKSYDRFFCFFVSLIECEKIIEISKLSRLMRFYLRCLCPVYFSSPQCVSPFHVLSNAWRIVAIYQLASAVSPIFEEFDCH